MSAYTLHCGWCRWERAPTAKTITKLLSSRTGSDSDGLQSAGTMGYTLAKALGESPEYTQGSSTLHPHHICIELDDMAKQSIGTVQAAYDQCLPHCFFAQFSGGVSPSFKPSKRERRLEAAT